MIMGWTVGLASVHYSYILTVIAAIFCSRFLALLVRTPRRCREPVVIAVGVVSIVAISAWMFTELSSDIPPDYGKCRIPQALLIFRSRAAVDEGKD